MNQEAADREVAAALFDELQQQLQPALEEAPEARRWARGNAVLDEIEQLFQQLNADIAAAVGNVVENYVYSGERAPRNVGNAIIDESLAEIPPGAFRHQTRLTDVEFGNNLDTVGAGAFGLCISLRGATMPSVGAIGRAAFSGCEQLEYAQFGAELRYVGVSAFNDCPSLRRITIPLKFDITFDDDAFKCDNLTTVDLVGADWLQKTISSLHMERWKNEMNQEINRINRVLPGLEDWEKTSEIQEWLDRVRRKFNRYKTEHQMILKEGMALLELALWKAKLDDDEKEKAALEFQPKKARMDVDSARKEVRITSGASVIIKNEPAKCSQ
jgi:hypothetical protein